MSHPASHSPPSGGHETRDIDARKVAWWGVGLVLLLVFTMIAMAPLLGILRERFAAASRPASPLAGSYGLTEPPEPRLQLDPAGDLAALRAREQALLDGYAWVDEARGAVRIPIREAMRLVAERRGGTRAE